MAHGNDRLELNGSWLRCPDLYRGVDATSTIGFFALAAPWRPLCVAWTAALPISHQSIAHGRCARFPREACLEELSDAS